MSTAFGDVQFEGHPCLHLLRRDFPALWSEASRPRTLLLIPRRDSLAGVSLDEGFFESHVIRSTEIFVNQYQTLNKRTVTLEVGVWLVGAG